ncbi:hypothetical protein HAX54_028959 [Datura stramonium]|uniref:Uncharacterized protein n=1 Tax=Datura stramonium TaxID=4076 RepID=A0ABS8S9Y3_DATST|nr:hypothetical protein [Datura stramonium]
MEIVYNNNPIFDVDSSTLPFLVEEGCFRRFPRVRLTKRLSPKNKTTISKCVIIMEVVSSVSYILQAVYCTNFISSFPTKDALDMKLMRAEFPSFQPCFSNSNQ